MKSVFLRSLVAVFAFLVFGSAHAAVDTTEVIQVLAETAGALAAIGLSFAVFVFSGKVWQWLAKFAS